MNTTLEEIITLYLAKIENFDYLEYSEEELLEELSPMLLSATSKLFSLNLKIDFDMEEFNRELEPIEQNLVALGLVEEFLTQKVNSIKVLKNHLTTKDFNLYSSANMLKQLRETLDSVSKEKYYLETRYEYKKRIRKILDGDK
jgi:hypothetical protein